MSPRTWLLACLSSTPPAQEGSAVQCTEEPSCTRRPLCSDTDMTLQPSTLRMDEGLPHCSDPPRQLTLGKAEDHPPHCPRGPSPHRWDRFISLATRWDMAMAATRRGSVTPMMLSPLGEGRTQCQELTKVLHTRSAISLA